MSSRPLGTWRLIRKRAAHERLIVAAAGVTILPAATLDSSNALTIMELVRRLVTREGVSAVVATHDPLLLDVADVVVALRDGRIR